MHVGSELGDEIKVCTVDSIGFMTVNFVINHLHLMLENGLYIFCHKQIPM